MADVRTNNISVPRIARNKRIYSGSNATYQAVTQNQSVSNYIEPTIVEFTAIDNPSIPDYSIYSDTYGQYPSIKLYEIDIDGNRIERTEKPYFYIVDDLISSIVFGILPDIINGFILIGK